MSRFFPSETVKVDVEVRQRQIHADCKSGPSSSAGQPVPDDRCEETNWLTG